MKKPKIEYTPEQEEARGELGAIFYGLDALARRAGCKSLKCKIVHGKGGSSELEYRREWDKSPPPYAAPEGALAQMAEQRLVKP